MQWAQLAIRYLHIGSAMFLAGGILFQAFVLTPALIAFNDEQRASLGTALRARWSKLVMATAGLLVITGLATVMIEAPKTDYEGAYMPLLGVKMLLALGIMFLSSLLCGRTEAAQKLRLSEGKWQKINALLVVILILIAGMLKTTPREPKVEASAQACCDSACCGRG